jgi:Cu/Ag efflux protein CusF
MLIADRVDDNGASSSGDCNDPGLLDEVGAITQVSADSITIDTQDQGSMTFSVDDQSVTDGFQVGDVVDVSYADNGDGTYSAGDVEYEEQDVTGTVTAVSDGSMTITDAASGQSETFTADPGDGMFDGVAVGDQVDVNYHQSGSQLVVDGVDDQSGD